MPKSTKRFILTTSQLNSHKFRALTAGADTADFESNPIMYWLHVTPEGKSTEELLPVGFWDEIKKEGDEISAVPNFDDNDPFAMKLYHKVEHGTLRAASVEVDPIEMDTNKKNWVEGQKLPTVTKWRLGEASIVDRGSNKGAIVKLKYKGKTITLSDQGSAEAAFQSLQQTEDDKTMSKIKLNEKASRHLKLAADTEMDATEVVDKLVDALESKETELTTLKETAQTEKITLMVDKAVTDRKILAGQKDQFIKLAKADFGTTEAYLNSMQASASVKDRVQEEVATTELGKLSKLSWDELHTSNKLSRLKELDKETFKLKFREKYDKDPVD